MKKQVDISIPLSVIEDKIRQVFEKAGDPNASLISKIIAENLETTEVGISQTLLAFMGIEETTPWREGDECLVEPEKISSWIFDRKATEAAGLYYKGHIKARIKSINLRKKRAVTIEFDAIDVGKMRKCNSEVALNEIKFEKELVLTRPDLADLV